MLQHELNPLFTYAMLPLGPLVSANFGCFIAICYGHCVFDSTTDRNVPIGLLSHNK